MKRRFEEIFFRILSGLCAFVVFGGAAVLLGVVAYKGIPALSWEMLTSVPKSGYYMGGGGGILNAIAGSFMIGIGATVLSTPAALLVVVFLHEYGRSRAWATAVRFALDLLWGIPSIVYGVFGFALMMVFGMRASLLAGIVTVALLEFPIAARGMDEVVRLVPHGLREAAFGLGATKLEVAAGVIFKQVLPGLLTAVLVAFGRGIGDAASVLFTAGFSDRVPVSPGDPAATLPLAIFFQLCTPYPEVQARAYAAALVLTVFVLAVSVISRVASRRFERNRVSGD